MFSELFPILSTPDMERALRFYRDLLDGRVTYEFPAPMDCRHTSASRSARPRSASASLPMCPRRRSPEP